MKILVIIVTFCAFAFAEATQNQPNPTTQTAPNATQPIAHPVAAPMPYPNPTVQQNIIAQIQQMYPGAFITDMDYEGWGYEVEINDHLELFFDNNGKLLGQKWD